jgi:hypothetical protein
MSRFQWYIVDTDDATVTGSNDVEEFEELLDDDRYVILSGQHGKFYCGSRDEQNVEPYVDLDGGDADEDEEELDGD